MEFWQTEKRDDRKKGHVPFLNQRFYGVNKDRSRASGGSGIGLAIVKHLIQLHKGRVSAESRPGKGTAIFFTLPA